jgi:hypothetical protein
MAAFSTPETAALEQTVAETTTLGTAELDLDDAYEIERTCQHVLEGGYTRVSLVAFTGSGRNLDVQIFMYLDCTPISRRAFARSSARLQGSAESTAARQGDLRARRHDIWLVGHCLLCPKCAIIELLSRSGAAWMRLRLSM